MGIKKSFLLLKVYKNHVEKTTLHCVLSWRSTVVQLCPPPNIVMWPELPLIRTLAKQCNVWWSPGCAVTQEAESDHRNQDRTQTVLDYQKTHRLYVTVLGTNLTSNIPCDVTQLQSLMWSRRTGQRSQCADTWRYISISSVYTVFDCLRESS